MSTRRYYHDCGFLQAYYTIVTIALRRRSGRIIIVGNCIVIAVVVIAWLIALSAVGSGGKIELLATACPIAFSR